MDLNLIFDILFKLLALGCIFAILFWMFNLVESKVPEPFKQVVGWVRIFVLLLCGAMAILFIADAAGLGNGTRHLTLRSQ